MDNKEVKYVDGYLLTVPKDKLDAYRKVADEMARMWIEHGAVSVKECMGDDLTPDMGDSGVQNFPTLIDLQDNETVWYSYIEYASKEDRDRINKAVEAEMMEKHKDDPDHASNMPFEMKRMHFGGFTVEVNPS